MTLSRTNWVLAGVLALVVLAVSSTRVDYSRPNFQITFADDMTYSPASSAYAPNDAFANGRTLQAPVPGTIPRGAQVFYFAATPADAVRAGEELVSPISAKDKPASVERGSVTYKTYCVACHGGAGGGDGPVAKRGFPPPPSLLTGKSRQMKDGQLFHVLTYGQNSMPTFAAQLTPAMRWDVVSYIRSLQEQAPPPSQESAPVEENPADASTPNEPTSPPDSATPATSETEPQS